MHNHLPKYALARSLRKAMTFEEVLVWNELKASKRGVRFRKQHPVGPYVLDFVCLKLKLCVEIDGGHHNDAVDRRRTEYLKAQGWTVLRFWNNEVRSNMAGVTARLDEVLKALSAP